MPEYALCFLYVLVFTSFTSVKVVISQCKNTMLQVKDLHLCISKSTKVLTSKYTLSTTCKFNYIIIYLLIILYCINLYLDSK